MKLVIYLIRFFRFSFMILNFQENKMNLVEISYIKLYKEDFLVLRSFVNSG